MNVLDPFRRFFVEEDSDTGEALEHAHQLIEFSRMPYFATFMDYLEREGDKPLVLSDQVSTIVSGARANTFKEIRNRLRREIAQAAEFISREQRNA